MDEVNDASMSVLAEGCWNGGPKSYILNIKEATYYAYLGQKNKVNLTKLGNIYSPAT